MLKIQSHLSPEILLEIHFLKGRSTATVEMFCLWAVLGDYLGKIREDVRFRKARSKKSNNSMGWMLCSRKREPFPGSGFQQF